MSQLKAISPIIAIIIILLITIAIAGAGYSYISAYWSGLVGKEIQVVSSFCTGANQGKVMVRNIGTSPLETGDITVIDPLTGGDITQDVAWSSPDIGMQSNPGLSCLDILEKSSKGDGAYWIDPDGTGSGSPFQAYCDMTYDSGGWTMLMKATRGTTFDYDANYWTTANILNENDATRNDGDAKYRSFNELEITDIMARWPDAGDIRWLKNSAWTSRTALTGFNEYRNWGIPQEQPNWNPTYFSSQAKQCDTGPGAYGTKLADLGGIGAGSRWGYRFNENGCGGWGSDDAGGGIGIRAAGYIGPLAATGASAGDSYGCCGLIGMNRMARVEVYGRESEISSSAEITVQPGETATLTHTCAGVCRYNLVLGGMAREAMLEC